MDECVVPFSNIKMSASCATGLELTNFFYFESAFTSIYSFKSYIFRIAGSVLRKKKIWNNNKKNREKNCKFYCQLFYYSSFIHNNLFYSEKFWRYVLQFISALRHNVEMITNYSVDDSFKQRFSCMIIFYVRFFVCFYCVARQMVTFKMTT